MTGIVDWLTAWYNVPYLFALAVAVSFSLFQVFFGLLPDALDVELDVDGDGDLDVDVEVDLDGDGELADKAGFAADAMAFMGVGKAPMAVLGLCFLMIFGGLGVVLNAALVGIIDVPLLSPLVALPTMAANAFVSSFITGRLAGVLNRYLPGHDTVSASGRSTVHQQGVATTVINEKGGTVQLSAAKWVDAVSAPGRSIPKGSQVLLVSYDPERTRYMAEPI